MVERIRIDGLEDVDRALKRLPLKLQGRAVHSAVNAGSQVFVKAARQAAPVLKKPDPRRTSGALKRNITKQRRTRGVRITSLFAVGVEHGAIPKPDRNGNVLITRGKRAGRTRKLTARERRNEDPYYWHFMESGYTAVGTRRGGPGRAIEGRGFIAGALTAKKSQATEKIRAKLARNIERLNLKS